MRMLLLLVVGSPGTKGVGQLGVAKSPGKEGANCVCPEAPAC